MLKRGERACYRFFSAVDAGVVQDVGGEVGADIGGRRAIAARHPDDVGDTAKVDGLAIHSGGALDGDGELGAFAAASLFDVLDPAGGGGSGSDEHLAIHHYIAAHAEVERIANRYVLAVYHLIEHYAYLRTCGEGDELLDRERRHGHTGGCCPHLNGGKDDGSDEGETERSAVDHDVYFLRWKMKKDGVCR